MSSSLSPDQRKALVRDYLETAWNSHKTSEESDTFQHFSTQESDQQSYTSCSDAVELPTCVYVGVKRLSIPLAQVRKTIRTTFPDIHLTITNLVVEEEMVVARWMMQGTDLGGFQGHLPTGRAVQLTGMTMVHIEDRVLVEEWNEIDVAGLLEQLGFVYTPQPPRITMRRAGPTQL